MIVSGRLPTTVGRDALRLLLADAPEPVRGALLVGRLEQRDAPCDDGSNAALMRARGSP